MQVVFDLDGVLLDSESDLGWLWDALDSTLDSLGVAVTPDNRAKLAPGNLRELPSVAAAWGLSPDELWTVRNERYLDAKLSAIDTGCIDPFDDVEAIEELDGRSRHIISNSPAAVVTAFVARNGFDDLFDVCLGRGNGIEWLDRLKPDPFLFRALTSRTGWDEGYLYVGNTGSDRRFAEATGMDYFHVDRTEGVGLWDLRAELD